MVSADTIRTVVGILGNAISLGLFLSPVPTFYRIWKKGSVEQFSPVPYIATLLNCMFWVVYGLPAVHPHSTLVLTINGSGVAIQLSYILLFVAYSRGAKRLRAVAALVSETAFVAIVGALVVVFARTIALRSMIVGILCVFFGTMMYAAPLSVMKLVVETKSVEFMPLFLSLASFFNGLCWTTYALIRFDLYIIIPNGLGVLFAIAQLVLHLLYYKSTKEQVEARKRKAAETGLAEVVVHDDAAKVNDKNTARQQNGHRPQI